jgi:Na+/proline symporter/signal transduction histidine kinase/ActR/RegA family two-component response regulator
MFEGWSIALLAFAYVGLLFAIAWIGDRRMRVLKGGGQGRPVIYALSIAVYCTSWTFFGSVGLAATTGYSFLPVYLGAIIAFTIGQPLILRIVRLAKSQNITSVADFLAARYGKSPAVAGVVTVIAVIGTLPYIALQLKAVAFSVEVLLGTGIIDRLGLPGDTALVIAFAMATFAMLFGTRHIDATEHQNGMMLAVAAESLIKLTAFLTVGLFVTIAAFGDLGGLATAVRSNERLGQLFGSGINVESWITITLLSFFAILLLPRQFHVAVVENNAPVEVRRAAWLFPLYLVAINLFVLPIAAAGLIVLPAGTAPDTFVLALPIAFGSPTLTLIAFIGGLSAATAMVIVDTVALAIMVCNGLVLPMLLARRLGERAGSSTAAAGIGSGMAETLLTIRRIAIYVIVLLGYVFYRMIEAGQGLATIGLVSFAAIAQLAPAFFAGLFWRRGTARGAIAGMCAGFLVWGYTLLLPWIVKSLAVDPAILSQGPFGLGWLAPQSLFYVTLNPLSHGVFWSLAVNIATLVVVSQLKAPEPIERLQANLFIADDAPTRAMTTPSFRLWRSSVTAGDLQATVARYLGKERAERSFQEFAESRGQVLAPAQEADIQLMRFTEHLLASAIGAPSSRLVLSLLLRRGNLGNQAALRLLDDASEALQYNRDLLQSALDQVRHGLSVFDQDMRLVCWNRQFRELFEVPADLGRVGAPLDRILKAASQHADAGRADPEGWASDRLMKLAIRQETFHEQFHMGQRVLEIRTAPMPQGGIVTTYSDITERVRAAEALRSANEGLEARVRERTAELTDVNRALARAKAQAEEANLDKTRFLAAASHDVLQPLNAARLYATSLAERQAGGGDAGIARNIDASLEAVEEILGALIDIARLDTGRMDPEIGAVPLNDLFEQLKVEFAPLARERGLDLRIVPTRLWVKSDRRLLRRVLQNLVSNAIKYTRRGGVVIGMRRRAGKVVFQVSDTGPGIAASKQALIFKEFERLEETARDVRGLGLGLSIVERIGKMLVHRIGVASTPGRGSTFTVEMEATAAVALPAATVQGYVGGLQLTGLTVLCIDNEPAVRDGMATLLGGWGCRVVTADAAATAIAAAAGQPAPDIIIADYHLDFGSGLDAIATLRRHFRRDVPAVVVTADASLEVQRVVREAGHALLRKPLKAAALRALITQMTLRRAVAAE